MRVSLRSLCIALVFVGVLNFGAFALHSQLLGGYAIIERPANGRFYVADVSGKTEVSQRTWLLVRWHALSLLLTYPLLLVAGAMLFLRHGFFKRVFRGSAEKAERTAREIHGGNLIAGVSDCSGRIGALGFRPGLLKVAIYSDGICFKLIFVGEFGILTSEIERVENKASLFRSGLEITHSSPDVVSPILLRCAHNEAATRALLALNNRV